MTPGQSRMPDFGRTRPTAEVLALLAQSLPAAERAKAAEWDLEENDDQQSGCIGICKI